ncbi:MAG: hypothetical protein WED04_00435 [Promethearchaeati archaeon SRVP18_Atabeyarchaeia-1]
MLSGRARALLVLALVVGVGMVCAFGFGVKQPSATTPLAAERVDGQGEISFTIAVQKTTFWVGEPVNITFTVTNICDHNVTLVGSALMFGFTVYDLSNNIVYVDGAFLAVPSVLWGIPLSPGESVTAVLIWPQTCNQTLWNPWGVPVQPGRYFIVGLFYGGLGYGLSFGPLEVDVYAPIPASTAVAAVVVAPAVVLLAAVLLGRKR